jgi:50S ribosomal subunit-associated GTPase HflX
MRSPFRGRDRRRRSDRTAAATDAATFAGKGKVEEIAARRVESGADLVIFNHPLTGAQQRNLDARSNVASSIARA